MQQPFQWKMHTHSISVMEKVKAGEVVGDGGLTPPPMWPWSTACLMGCGCVYWEQEALFMHAPSRALVLRDESLLVSLCHIPASAWHLPGPRATRRVHGPTGLTGWCTWSREVFVYVCVIRQQYYISCSINPNPDIHTPITANLVFLYQRPTLQTVNSE